MFARILSTSCSLMLKVIQIGSIWTMVASWVGEVTPTSAPTDWRWLVTTPSKGAFTSV
jgi:hypothetical protein